MGRMTKRQMKDNDRIMAYINQEEFKENSRAKPAVPELTILDVLNGYTPPEQSAGAKFYTPTEMGLEFVSYGPIGPHTTILEPAAGIGNLIYALLDMGVHPEYITAYDLDQNAVKIGTGLFPGVNWINDTPLDHHQELTGKFDVVVMNAPFNCTWGTSEGLEMAEGRCKKSEHLFLELALRAVKPEGVVMAIGAYNLIDRLPKKARAWFDKYTSSFHDQGKLPGEFNGTGMSVNGFIIYRNEIPIEGLPTPEKLVKNITTNTAKMGERINDLSKQLADNPPKIIEKGQPNGNEMATKRQPERVEQSDMFDGKKPELLEEGTILLERLLGNLHPNFHFTRTLENDFIDSIKKYGVIDPIDVELMDDQYFIRAGQHRILASQKLGLESIPWRLSRYPLGMGAVVGLETNIRRSRNPVDEYHHLQEIEKVLADRGKTPTDTELAKILQIPINKLRKMRCVGIMPEAVQTGITDGRITINNAYDLARLAPSRQEPLVAKLEEGERVTAVDIKDQKLVVRQEEQDRVIPLLDIPENGRSDLPQKKFVAEAVDKLLAGLPVVNVTKDRITEFAYQMMVNPEKALEDVWK